MLICLVQAILLDNIFKINITRYRITNFKLVGWSEHILKFLPNSCLENTAPCQAKKPHCYATKGTYKLYTSRVRVVLYI